MPPKGKAPAKWKGEAAAKANPPSKTAGPSKAAAPSKPYQPPESEDPPSSDHSPVPPPQPKADKPPEGPEPTDIIFYIINANHLKNCCTRTQPKNDWYALVPAPITQSTVEDAIPFQNVTAQRGAGSFNLSAVSPDGKNLPGSMTKYVMLQAQDLQSTPDLARYCVQSANYDLFHYGVWRDQANVRVPIFINNIEVQARKAKAHAIGEMIRDLSDQEVKARFDQFWNNTLHPRLLHSTFETDWYLAQLRRLGFVPDMRTQFFNMNQMRYLLSAWENTSGMEPKNFS